MQKVVINICNPVYNCKLIWGTKVCGSRSAHDIVVPAYLSFLVRIFHVTVHVACARLCSLRSNTRRCCPTRMPLVVWQHLQQLRCLKVGLAHTSSFQSNTRRFIGDMYSLMFELASSVTKFPPVVCGDPMNGFRNEKKPISLLRPRNPLPPSVFVILLGEACPRPEFGLLPNEGDALKFRRCFLYGEGTWLEKAWWLKKNFGSLSKCSILPASGVSLRSARIFWSGFSASCRAARIIYSLPIWYTTAALTAILAAPLSYSIKIVSLVVLVGWLAENMSSLFTIMHILYAWSNQIMDPLHPLFAFGLYKQLIYGL